MAKSCVFCDIVKGKTQADKIYEDSTVLAILHKNSYTEGHTIIMTKKHYRSIFDIEENDLEHLMEVAKKLAEFYRKELRCEGVDIMHASGKAAGQNVQHFHIHLVPRYKTDGLGELWHKQGDFCVNNFLIRGRLLTSKYFKTLGKENLVKPIKQ